MICQAVVMKIKSDVYYQVYK